MGVAAGLVAAGGVWLVPCPQVYKSQARYKIRLLVRGKGSGLGGGGGAGLD